MSSSAYLDLSAQKWPSVPLEDVAIRVTDGTHQSPRFEADGIPFLVISDVISGTIDWSGVSKWVSEDTYDANTSRCRPARGDVLYTAVGSFGVAIPVESDNRFMFQRHIAHIKPDPKRIDTKFLTHVLNSPAMKAVAETVAKGVAQRTVTLGDLKRFEIPLPPLPEQRRVTAILDKADAIRRKRKQAITLTEDLLRSVFYEMFGDPVANSKGWPVKPVGELAEATSGVTKGKHYDGQTMVTVPYMRVANVQDRHLVLDEVKTITVSEAESRRYALENGDVLLTEGGDPDKLGRGAVWHGEILNCIHQNHIFRVRPGPQLSSEYLSAIVGSERGKRYFLSAAKQTTGIATINMTQLKAFPLPVPPMALQNAYSALIARVTTARERLALRHHLTDKLFGSLVACAFSGAFRRAESSC